jgi:ADP-ribose pyrophosphatase YjhB (NUDIX family)
MVREKEGWYGLPGGGLEYDETITQDLGRELVEEIGISIDELTISDLPVYIAHDDEFGGIPRLRLLYRAHPKGQLPQQQKSEMRIHWIDDTTLPTAKVVPSLDSAKPFFLSLMHQA